MFGLQWDEYSLNVFLSTDHYFPSLLARGNRTFLELFTSMPVGSYELVVSKVHYLRCTGEIKKPGSSPPCCFSNPELLDNQPSFTFQRLPLLVVVYLGYFSF